MKIYFIPTWDDEALTGCIYENEADAWDHANSEAAQNSAKAGVAIVIHRDDGSWFFAKPKLNHNYKLYANYDERLKALASWALNDRQKKLLGLETL